MSLSKSDHIASLALEVLEDTEMMRTSLEGLVLKASRLARLVGDHETWTWLWHERFGYNATDAVSLKYLGLTSRWTDHQKQEAYFGAAIIQESVLESLREQLEVVKKFVPSGEWSSIQFQTQQERASAITNSMIGLKRVISAIRAQVQEFATRVYHERVFSHEAESIFTDYQDKVDGLLSSTAATAFQRMPKAFERLSAGHQEPEAVSHALMTCRRVIDSFADAVFPARSSPAQIGQEEIAVGEKQVRNRLRAYIWERIGSTSRYERLNKMLGSLYDRVSAGVHSEVDVGEGRALVLQTYLFLGELLSLPHRKASEV